MLTGGKKNKQLNEEIGFKTVTNYVCVFLLQSGGASFLMNNASNTFSCSEFLAVATMPNSDAGGVSQGIYKYINIQIYKYLKILDDEAKV